MESNLIDLIQISLSFSCYLAAFAILSYMYECGSNNDDDDGAAH